MRVLKTRSHAPRPGRRGFEAVRVALGVFLLAAGGLKAHGLTLDPLSQDSFLSSPRVLIATIQLEVLLGLWLLSGWSQRGAWRVSLLFFAVLAAISAYLGLVGQASCGCFGRVPVNPWITFAIDVGIVALLWAAKPRPSLSPLGERGRGEGVSTPREVVSTALGALAFLALIAGAFFLLFDNPVEALARLRGESIGVEPTVSDVGSAVAGTHRDFAIELVNHTDHPVRIVGGTTTCGCIATRDLPVELPAHESRSITVQMTFRGSPGRFLHRFILYTDHDDQRLVTARFAGRVTEPPSP